MIKGIAFDLEGTVVDVEAAHHQGHFVAAREVGVELDLDSALEKLPHFIGGPDDRIAEEILALSPQKDSITAEQILVRDKYWYEIYLKELPVAPRPGFLRVFNELKEHGFLVSIGSLTAEIQATFLLDQSGLKQLFGAENIVLREHVENMKPAPDVFLKTAAIMGLDPKEQLVFEDSSNGVRAARAAGSIAIGMPVYNRPETVQALTEAGASKIFTSWEEINIEELIRELSS